NAGPDYRAVLDRDRRAGTRPRGAGRRQPANARTPSRFPARSAQPDGTSGDHHQARGVREDRRRMADDDARAEDRAVRRRCIAGSAAPERQSRRRAVHFGGRTPMTTSLDIHGPAGILEALLDTPESSPRAVAVVAHPHPQYGGTLHTKAVYQAA